MSTAQNPPPIPWCDAMPRRPRPAIAGDATSAGVCRGGFPRCDAVPPADHGRPLPATPRLRRKTRPPFHGVTPCPPPTTPVHGRRRHVHGAKPAPIPWCDAMPPADHGRPLPATPRPRRKTRPPSHGVTPRPRRGRVPCPLVQGSPGRAGGSYCRAGGRVSRAPRRGAPSTAVRAGNHGPAHCRQTRPYATSAGVCRGGFPRCDAMPPADHGRPLPATPCPRRKTRPPSHGVTPGHDGGGFRVRWCKDRRAGQVDRIAGRGAGFTCAAARCAVHRGVCGQPRPGALPANPPLPMRVPRYLAPPTTGWVARLALGTANRLESP